MFSINYYYLAWCLKREQVLRNTDHMYHPMEEGLKTENKSLFLIFYKKLLKISEEGTSTISLIIQAHLPGQMKERCAIFGIQKINSSLHLKHAFWTTTHGRQMAIVMRTISLSYCESCSFSDSPPSVFSVFSLKTQIYLWLKTQLFPILHTLCNIILLFIPQEVQPVFLSPKSCLACGNSVQQLVSF